MTHSGVDSFRRCFPRSPGHFSTLFYTHKELLGFPHNIIRHPDMPEEAFADMWAALKAGRVWTGLVKNRCKNGDYYWVEANSAPLYENELLIGYMSVRTKPSAHQVTAANVAYSKFKANKADNLRIQDGRIIELSLLTRLNLFRQSTIKSRLLTIVGLLCLFMLTLGGLGLYGMSESNEGLRTVYEDRTVAMAEIATIQKLLLFNRIRITAALSTPTPDVIDKSTKEVEQNLLKMDELWGEYLKTYLTVEEKQLADKFTDDRNRFISEGIQPIILALRANDIEKANALLANKIRPLYEPVGDGIQLLLEMQINVAKQEYESAQSLFEKIRSSYVGVVLVGVLLSLFLVLTLINYIVRTLNASVAKISKGDYTTPIEIIRQDELGNVLNAIKAMQIKLGFDALESQRIANANLRIKIGLDNVSTGVMITDNNRDIIYTNKSAVDILEKAEAAIRERLPQFSANNLLGHRFDEFYANSTQQSELLASLQHNETSDLNMGERSMVIHLNPVINEQGQRLGIVAEWLDRTIEVNIEKEVAEIVHGAALGDFTRRVNVQDKEGFYSQLALGLNELLETTENGINDVVRVLEALSNNDLTQSISNDYAGSFGQLKDDTNLTVEKLKDIVNQIMAVTHSINIAAKEIASGNNDLSHRTEEQAASLEQTAASMEELTSTVQANNQNANYASQLASNSSAIASRGAEVVGQVIRTMGEINQSSRKIGDIISVIDDIAFQTNILALNAAVEAARAGDSGKGFAVVAVEVRNLAQRAAKAAGEIKLLINDSVDKVDDGTRQVTKAGQTMEEIVNSIHGVTEIMSQISTASLEQTSGIRQVNQAIGQMDDVTQQNAALVEQAAAAAESMSEQAQILSNTVSLFNVGEQTYETPQHSLSGHPRAAQLTSAHKKTVFAKPAFTSSKVTVSNEDLEWEEF